MRKAARGIVDYSWDSQGRFILVPLDGDLYLDSVADGKDEHLKLPCAIVKGLAYSDKHGRLYVAVDKTK